MNYNVNNIGQRTNASKAGTAVPSGPSSTITYYYDASNRRIAQTTGSNTTVYVYDAWNCIAEYSIQNSLFTIHSSYTWGLDLSQTLQGAGGVGGLLMVSRITNNTVTDNYFPVYDGNGNVTEYLDDSATVVAHYQYDPFGNTTVATGTKANDFSHRFSTKPLDIITGLYYYGYRWYDPLTGRWPLRDPIGERGGLNLYSFVSNNGVNGTDLLGLSGGKGDSPGDGDTGEVLRIGPINMQRMNPCVIVYTISGRNSDYRDGVNNGMQQIAFWAANMDTGDGVPAAYVAENSGDHAKFLKDLVEAACKCRCSQVTLWLIGHSWGGGKADEASRFLQSQSFDSLCDVRINLVTIDAMNESGLKVDPLTRKSPTGTNLVDTKTTNYPQVDTHLNIIQNNDRNVNGANITDAENDDLSSTTKDHTSIDNDSVGKVIDRIRTHK